MADINAEIKAAETFVRAARAALNEAEARLGDLYRQKAAADRARDLATPEKMQAIITTYNFLGTALTCYRAIVLRKTPASIFARYFGDDREKRFIATDGREYGRRSGYGNVDCIKIRPWSEVPDAR